MKKRNISNLVLGTALVSVAAYVAYRIYKKNKSKEEQNVISERKYTVLRRGNFSNNEEEFEQEENKSKVM